MEFLNSHKNRQLFLVHLKSTFLNITLESVENRFYYKCHDFIEQKTKELIIVEFIVVDDVVHVVSICTRLYVLKKDNHNNTRINMFYNNRNNITIANVSEFYDVYNLHSILESFSRFVVVQESERISESERITESEQIAELTRTEKDILLIKNVFVNLGKLHMLRFETHGEIEKIEWRGEYHFELTDLAHDYEDFYTINVVIGDSFTIAYDSPSNDPDFADKYADQLSKIQEMLRHSSCFRGGNKLLQKKNVRSKVKKRLITDRRKTKRVKKTLFTSPSFRHFAPKKKTI